jgi:hypothetical protein
MYIITLNSPRNLQGENYCSQVIDEHMILEGDANLLKVTCSERRHGLLSALSPGSCCGLPGRMIAW